jgi:glycosyltransferase involved in cell wall biosynthesis
MTEHKFSIITPTHKNSKFLAELYDSIAQQNYDNWEWVLYLNGSFDANLLEEKIIEDHRVQIFNSSKYFQNIGEVKHNAFNLATGDILVEVDHDDLISTDCLLELNKAYQDCEIGFVYSDSLLYDLSGKMKPFDKIYGWQYHLESFRGKEYIRHIGFEPSSQSLSFIWYSPDHIRSWRKSVYESIGGHNPIMEVCDDHELLIRTYLNTRLYRIDKCLYYYRIHPNFENTQFERNELIQKTTKELFVKYAQKLAERDAELTNTSKVDLGGGINPKPGYITIDQTDGNISCDLNNGIPLEDNSVGVINASHFIEHIKDPLKIMGEIHRVLCDGGWAFIEVPSTDGRGAWQDPTHVSFWNENSFWYYTRKEQADYIRNSKIKFQEFRLDTIWWDNNIAITHAWLCAIKSDKRRPHNLNI